MSAPAARAPAQVGDLRVRRSAPADMPALDRLAQLDSRPRPAGDHLLLEEDGELRAALPLDGGPAISDPFHRTAALVTILELRARSVGAGGDRRGVRRAGRLRRRLRARDAAADLRRSPVPST